MIVGPRTEIAAYWDLVREKHERPRLIRDRQFVMMLDRSMLRPYDRSVACATRTHRRMARGCRQFGFDDCGRTRV